MIKWTNQELLISLNEMGKCTICPRNCNANRLTGKTGYCRSDAGFNVSSICNHKGEEPFISGKNGICNVFFSHCNMQCIFCQNHQISRNDNKAINYKKDLDQIVEEIAEILDDGAGALGFVSPSHFIPQVKIIISALNKTGRKPITVFNTNGYDKPESIRKLEGLIDVYLPDFKYMDDHLGKIYSDTPDYSIYATKAIQEMYRQKGSTLLINDEGYAESGLIIRHLVLPGHVENSLAVLRFIADEISTNVHISLMSQYHPTINVLNHPELGRHLTAEEYAIVTTEMGKLGFRKGWIQELKSADFYSPDFLKNHPFESK